MDDICSFVEIAVLRVMEQSAVRRLYLLWFSLA